MTLTLDRTVSRNANGTCGCHPPNPSHRDGKSEWCAQCGGHIDPEWAITLDNTRAYLRRLEDAAPNIAPDSFDRFEAQVLRRQKAGESTFRQSGLAKDVQAECCEEATDAAMYAVIQLLKERRAGMDEEWDIALEIGVCAARIYELNELWKGKERGRAHAARAHEE